jgi:L-threonylcarbamoyladenylate synthase
MNYAGAHFETAVAPFTPSAIARAAQYIIEDLPVALPTETVYGLAARADSGDAVAGIYAAKGRPSFNPLIIHIASVAQAETIGRFDDTARTFAQHFWPGPLTLVLPLAPDAPMASLATAGLRTVALRIPAHPAMQALLEATGLPLAAPSANASGTISPTRAEHVLQSLGGRIPLIIDGGGTEHGLESTIVAVKPGALVLLRPGPITSEQLSEFSGLSVTTPHPDDGITAPGQLASHYAPSKPLRLNAKNAFDSEWLIGFGSIGGNVTLSATGNLVEAAARLFDLLHEADASPRHAIAVAPIPDEGLGIAINDRLNRAAAPR